ncbi:MAG: GbsR/MarR family transcriptional regulator [bacterium]
MTLSPVMQRFILHWGEMGTRWGVNRTVAQIHALLYLSPKPLNAEEIASTLSVARSSVSTSLRELQSWGLVKIAHVLGDRRDHFESMTDAWEMFRVVLQERKRREIDPTRTVLRESVVELQRGGSTDAYTRKRLLEMLEFFETMSGCYEQMRRLPTRALIRVVKMGGKVRKLLGIPS